MKSTTEGNLQDLNLKKEDKILVESCLRDDILENSTSTKKRNVSFSRFISEIGGIMSTNVKERISTCGDFLQFLSDEKIEHLKLENANFCGNRFCPQCSANKAREDAIQLSTMVEYLTQEFNYNFIFLTLTAPNISSDEVEEELKEYTKSFERLFKTKKVKAMSKGYVRKLEMTYNSESDTYHPHYHVLIAVNKSYFDDSRVYMSQKEWLSLWQKAKKDSSITQVDVRKFKSLDDRFKAIFEISKYISKDSDYMYSPEVFKVFYNTLKGKRMLSFSGCFKDAVKLYKAGDLVDYMGEDPSEKIKFVRRLWYAWDKSAQGYDAVQVQELSDEEIEKANLTRKEKIALKKQEEAEILKQNQEDAEARKVKLQKISDRVEKVRRERLEKISPEVNRIISNHRLNWEVFEILINDKSEKFSNVDILNNSGVLKSMSNSVQKPLEEISYKLAGIEKLKFLISKNKL